MGLDNDRRIIGTDLNLIFNFDLDVVNALLINFVFFILMMNVR